MKNGKSFEVGGFWFVSSGPGGFQACWGANVFRRVLLKSGVECGMDFTVKLVCSDLTRNTVIDRVPKADLDKIITAFKERGTLTIDQKNMIINLASYAQLTWEEE